MVVVVVVVVVVVLLLGEGWVVLGGEGGRTAGSPSLVLFYSLRGAACGTKQTNNKHYIAKGDNWRRSSSTH